MDSGFLTDWRRLQLALLHSETLIRESRRLLDASAELHRMAVERRASVKSEIDRLAKLPRTRRFAVLTIDDDDATNEVIAATSEVLGLHCDVATAPESVRSAMRASTHLVVLASPRFQRATIAAVDENRVDAPLILTPTESEVPLTLDDRFRIREAGVLTRPFEALELTTIIGDLALSTLERLRAA